MGHIVSLNLVINNFTATQGVWVNFATLPAGYIPAEKTDFIAVNNVTDLGLHVRITTVGAIGILIPAGESLSVTPYITVTYMVE